jgi:uncharacterized protein (UPF0335 family)
MIDQQYLTKTVARIAQLQANKAAIEDEIEELYGTLGELEERNYPAGPYILKVTRTRRFDEATAKRNLPPHLFNMILKKKPDSALAKAQLSEDEYALCQREYGWTKKIERVVDEE